MNAEQQATLAELREALGKIERGETAGLDTSVSEHSHAEGADASTRQDGDGPAGSPDGLLGTGPAPDAGRAPGAAGSRESAEGDIGPDEPDRGPEKARALVLRKITGSPKTRHQLAEALREKEFPAEVAQQVLDRLEEVHLIDDAAFARAWVRTRHESKNLGRRMLQRELREKGIDDAVAEAALSEISEEDEDSAARDLIESKLRGITIPRGNSPEDRKERDKIVRRVVGALGRRGHSPGSSLTLVFEAIEERTA